MKFAKLRYLLVFVCLFCLMEKTGISVISLFSKIDLFVSDLQTGKQNDNAGERSETKQIELKEYWAIHPNSDLTLPDICSKLMRYPGEITTPHYNWCPPVPTPPPTFIV